MKLAFGFDNQIKLKTIQLIQKLNDLYEQIRPLPALEKICLVKLLHSELEIPDQGIKEIWAEESDKGGVLMKRVNKMRSAMIQF